MKCPICEHELKTDSTHNDHIIMESENVCAKCQRYKKYFHTGNYQLGIRLETGWRIWEWSYDTSRLEHEKINLEILRMARMARAEHEEATQ